MSTYWQDVRYALRTLRKGWLVTTVAVVSLALAIGGNAAVFSMVDAFIFRPLPYEQPDRVVLLGERDKDQPEGQGATLSTSLATYADLAERSRTMGQWGALRPRTLSVRGSERAEAVSGVMVTPGFFEVMRVSAARGRVFLPGEGVEGARKVAVLSHEYWVRAYGETDDPLGAVLTINGDPHEVVGILPEGFEFLTPNQDVWVPIAEAVQGSPRDRRDLFAVARMRDGATMEAVRSEMTGLFEQLEAEYPGAMQGKTVDAYNLRYDIPTGQTRVLFGLLQGSVFLVLLIACVNITNLLLARGQERTREIALRTALGAARSRIVRQLLTETSFMVIAAGLLGLGLGWWGVRLAAGQLSAVLPAQYELALDMRVLTFTLGVAAIAGLSFGLVPALQTLKTVHVEALKEGGRAGRGRSRKRLSKALVIGEIALSFVALGGGSLLLRSFLELRESDPGFETAHVLTALYTAPPSRTPTEEQQVLFADRILEQVRALNGVTAATLTNSIPQGFQTPQDSFRIAGQPLDAGTRAPLAMTVKVDPGYLETLGLTMVQGRFFEESDRSGAAPVVVVNRALADAHFEGGQALGKRLELDGEPHDIVGVTADIQQLVFRSPGQTDQVVYRPRAQDPAGARWIMARTESDPERAKEPMRLAVEALDPDLTVSQLRTMEEHIAQFFVGVDVFNAVLGGFGVMALLMAALGTYGVLAHSVGQRSHEIGIRLAVGARPRGVVRMIARQGIALGLIGLALGVLMTLPLIGLMNSLLQGVSTVKPLTLVLIGSVLFGVTLVASFMPAGRAATVDPARTLRGE